MKLIVGLGNPGPAYRWTRHNMGFWLIEEFAQAKGLSISRKGCHSLYGRGKVGFEDVILAKPQTFMNRSGEAVRALLSFLQMTPQDLLVLHDDLDLPPGKIRIRLRGSDGGHRGIRSIIEAIGSGNFLRVKMGIGRPADPHQDPVEFVLERIPMAEREIFQRMMERAVDALETLILEGPQKAMSRFHPEPKTT